MKIPKMLLAAMILAVTGNVRAHDWYPKECCGGHDCAPATVEQIPVTPALAQQLQTTLPSAMMITTSYGTSIIRELIPFEFGGAVELSFANEGTRCRLEIPGEWVGRGPQKGEAGSRG